MVDCPHCGLPLDITKSNVSKSRPLENGETEDLCSGIVKSTTQAVESQLDTPAVESLRMFSKRTALQSFSDDENATLGGGWLGHMKQQMHIREEVIKSGGVLPGHATSEEESTGAAMAAKIQRMMTGGR